MYRKAYNAAGDRLIEALVGPVGYFMQKKPKIYAHKESHLLELPSVYILISCFDP